MAKKAMPTPRERESRRPPTLHLQGYRPSCKNPKKAVPIYDVERSQAGTAVRSTHSRRKRGRR